MLNRIKNPRGERQVPVRWSELKWTTALVFKNEESVESLPDSAFVSEAGFTLHPQAVSPGEGAGLAGTFFFSIKTRLSASRWTISQSLSL